MSQHNPDIIHFSATRDEPASVRLTRGLRAARLVEEALSMVPRPDPMPGGARSGGLETPHRRARKQLRKLLDRLEVLQQSVLSEGLSQVGQDYLTGELEALESALQAILDQPVRKRTLTRVRRLARTTRTRWTPGRADSTAVRTRFVVVSHERELLRGARALEGEVPLGVPTRSNR